MCNFNQLFKIFSCISQEIIEQICYAEQQGQDLFI